MAEWIIDQLFPSREVHIIAGPSGAGKTTWALQTLVWHWQKGEDVLGFKSYPVPWFYISSDRSLQSVHATMKRLGISSEEFMLTSAVDAGIHDMTYVMKAMFKANPRPKLLYIDGLLNLLPDKVHPNDNKSVCKWLADQTRRCQLEDITIIGSLHSPKMKRDEWYDNARQRISGGASWAGYADTIVLMELEDSSDPMKRDHRRLTILPRNHAEVVRHLVFTREGKLVDAEEDLRSALFDGFLLTKRQGETFSRETVALVMQTTPGTVGTWLTQAEKVGLIESFERGKYRKL
jgi:hypothetical protein